MATKNVQLPDGRVVAFPDSMSDEDISAAIRKDVGDSRSVFQKAKDNFNAATQGAKPGDGPVKSFVENVGAGGGDAVRAVVHLPSTIKSAVTTPDPMLDYIAGDKNRAVANAQPSFARALGAAGTSAILGEAAGAVPIARGVTGIVDNAENIPNAVTRAATKFKNSTYPKNLSLTPDETSAQEFAKALKPPVKAVERIKGAASEVPAVLDYSQRTGTPINGKLDFAKAAEGAANEVQQHYDNNLLRPHAGDLQQIPDGYGGETTVNNRASLKQINERVNDINKELKSNFRKSLASETNQAQASDAALNAEKSKLTKVLHGRLAELNGLEPEDIATTRQRAGKLRTLAEETKLSGNQDTLSAARHETGSAISPIKNALDSAGDAITGGPEIIGNRLFKNSLEGFEPGSTPLPQPALPDPNLVPTSPEAAQQEFLRSQSLEQSAQDAAAARNAEAERLRTQNVDTQKQAAAGEAVRATTGEQSAQDLAAARSKFADSRRRANATADQQQRMAEGAALRDTGRARVAAAQNPEAQPTIQDQQVVAPDASRGVQPVTLPVEVPPSDEISAAPTPDTHHFSKEALAQLDPNADVEAAAELAKQAGYEVV